MRAKSRRLARRRRRSAFRVITVKIVGARLQRVLEGAGNRSNEGRRISPLTAAAHCVKPRGQMTPRQICIVDALTAESMDFAVMRQFAMRLRGLFRGGSLKKLDEWIWDATSCSVYAIRRFAKTLRQDIDAVQNAVVGPWSNGQTEGQINRLKTLKRSMYGRASIELLRARMLPLHDSNLHRE
ncbi:transposase [Methylosinus sporium]|uniref:transposase n=2 Tax=Methylosinus sporium TaxID=428 RepID=UPI001AEEC9AB|nr:transposase [Methylosinus sporium]